MGALERPYISIVIASRNDGYAGGMLRRLQVCANALVAQMERFDVPAELILIDWNPPPGKDLWSALKWPSIVRRCTIRVITVPARLHATFPFADRLPILIHRARNVGVRRATGSFVLPTSADILLSDELTEWFSQRQLDPSGMYRVARRDVPVEALEYTSHKKRLKYCRKHVQQVHGRGPSHRISGLPDLFTNGAGDFTLLSRELYFQLRGIPEEREFHSMHFDSVFCFMAHAAGAREIELAEPLRIYHVDHGPPSWRERASWLERAAMRLPVPARMARPLLQLARRIAPPSSALTRRRIPHLDCSTPTGQAQYEALVKGLTLQPDAFQYNDAEWGLAAYSLEERVLGPAPG